jgi:hypothetical protein
MGFPSKKGDLPIFSDGFCYSMVFPYFRMVSQEIAPELQIFSTGA